MTREEAEEIAANCYGGHPEAADLMLVGIYGSTELERRRAVQRLTLIDPESGNGHCHAADHPDAEKEPQAGPGPQFYIQSAPDFFAEVDPPEVYLANELLPAESLVLLHGEPRTRKSWASQELGVALATGTPPFGLERFAVKVPVPVLYSSQEDARRRVRARAQRLLAGRGLPPPETLHFSVHAGIDLEDDSWQEALIRDVARLGLRLVILDPIRRYSRNVDKGPADVGPVTAFLRRLIVEAHCSVLAVHHDVKPARNGEDTRRRGQRASGGDWFAASECPIHAEVAGRDRTLLVPEDFKFGEDPKAFTFAIEEDDQKAWARVVGQDVDAGDVGRVALHERILEFLRHNPGSPGNAVARGARGGKAAILDALKDLADAARVDSVVEKRAIRWFVRGEV